MNTDPVSSDNLRDVPLSEALSERYLSYALSTIVARSLPDVRDGLKPVHRRLLHAMRVLKLDPSSGFKKCARVVGDVIGKYHPHGDSAVYDAMVRLAQNFAQRYPLVEGHGNFGSIDGDRAAAMRYTEARLTPVAIRLLDGLDEDAVDFIPTYDGEDHEPVVLPAGFPNLLANGASGIAVGMATNIPPHNIAEICRALRHLIKHPHAEIDTLLTYMPGPDFPTGGEIVSDPQTIREAYATGRGSVRVRARWMVEDIGQGKWQIVVNQIPYQVQKSRLIERIADLLQSRKLPMLADLRDESSDTLRLILEPKSRNADPGMLMETMFRLSDLESRISLNLNVLDASGTPGVMNLRQILQAYLDHRHEVLIRCSGCRLSKVEDRLEILQGYRVVYLNLDQVIDILRHEDQPKPRLMATFTLSDRQAEAILDMRLRRLRKLEEHSIDQECDQLNTERADLQSLLNEEKRRWTTISDDIRALAKSFGPQNPLASRRTGFAPLPDNQDIPTLIEREPITVLCSRKGWIRAARGHLDEDWVAKYKEGDGEGLRLHAQTTDTILVFASNGRFYRLSAEGLPGGRGYGEPLRLLLDLPQSADVIDMRVYDPMAALVVASRDGRGFVVKQSDALAQTRGGKQVLNLNAGAKAHVCTLVTGDHIAVLGDNGNLLVFPLSELPTLTRGRGVIVQKYRQGGLSDMKAFSLQDGLTWSSTGGGKRRVVRTQTDLTSWLGKRAQVGRKRPKGTLADNTFGSRGS